MCPILFAAADGGDNRRFLNNLMWLGYTLPLLKGNPCVESDPSNKVQDADGNLQDPPRIPLGSDCDIVTVQYLSSTVDRKFCNQVSHPEWAWITWQGKQGYFPVKTVTPTEVVYHLQYYGNACILRKRELVVCRQLMLQQTHSS